MKNLSFKKLSPYLAGILIFMVITMVYLSPLMEGKMIKQGDKIRGKGMAKEIVDFREKTGKEPLWTNNMFSGMPAYQISIRYSSTKIIHFFDKMFQLWLPHPADYVFLYMAGFFILMIVMGVNPWLGLAGSIAFGFSSYFFIILEAGHTNKAHAIGYMAPVLAGVILAYRGKYLLGGALTAFFLALQIKSNHLQITYYLALIVIIFVITELIVSVKQKKFKHFLIASFISLAAALLAVGPNIANLWTTAEYGKYTIRGKSELTFNKDNKTSGLDRDYATAWSYDIPETFTLMIPNFKGGSSHAKLKEGFATYDRFEKEYGKRSAEQATSSLPMYWGEQSFTSGPVYVGAIVVFLFVFAMFYIKHHMKYWVLAATILSIFLAWGHHFEAFTNFFLDYVPGYNKFRTVSMTLVMAELLMPFLGIIAIGKLLDDIRNKNFNKEKNIRYLQYAFGITGGLALLFALFGSSFFDFRSIHDEAHQMQLQQYGYPDWVMQDTIIADRARLFRMDAWRSFLFILLSAAAIWAVMKNKLKPVYLIPALAFLILVDMWPVNKRYLNDSHFDRKRNVTNPYRANEVDMAIMQDTDPYYRVFNATVRPDQDARTSYFHKSIGGYHGAKLKRYQELIDYHINRRNIDVLNMLNTKYFIYKDNQGNVQPQRNVAALGNVWYIKDYIIVENADKEIKHLDKMLVVKNLAPQSSAMKINGKIKEADTIGLFQAININHPTNDASYTVNPYLYGFNMTQGEKYTLGYNPKDSSKNYINLQPGPNIELVAPKQLHVEVIYAFNPKEKAIIHKEFADQLMGYQNGLDENAKIFLTEYQPNELKYYAKTSRDQLAVFSDIYYEKGWNAYVDGKLTPHFRCNYVLRAMIVPEGEHEIVFKFEPRSYYTGEKAGWISSIVLMLILIGILFVEYRGGWKKQA